MTLRQQLLASTLFVGTSLIAAPAFAQAVPVEATRPDAPGAADQATVDPTTESQETSNEEEIVITGTLQRNPNLEQSSPVAVIGAEEIELQQANLAEEFLRELPGAVPSIGSAVNNGNGGASFVNLRGLGSNRNLVLLDGTRLVPAGLGGVVDLNNIPLALVERVDILTGGASTTYGADAISGVVNFITKDDFAGAELSLSEQITEDGDGNTFRADATLGANFDDGKGNAVISIGYQQADPVYQGDRPFSVENLSGFSGRTSGSGTTVPSRISVPGVGTRQIDPATGALVPTFALFNFNPFNIFQTPFERFNIFGSGSYEISDGIEPYVQALFSKNTVSTIIAPSGTFGNALTIPFSNPFLPVAARNQLCTANGLTAAQCTAAAAATSPTDPNFRTFTSTVSRRFVEGGPRLSDFTTTIFQVKAGVRGDLFGNFGYDLYGTYGESENIQRQTGQGLLTRLRQAVNATNPNTCIGNPTGCVPINLFGPAGSITPEQFNFLNVTTSASTLTSLGTIRGVVNGDLGFASPMAEDGIGVAVGGEYRKYNAANSSDLANQTPGEVLGNGAASPDTRGEYNVKEAFAEIVAPLIQNRPFFESLTLELGARVSDYSTSGTSYTYKAGGSWEPVKSLKIRGNYNRAARSPNIGELFSPNVTGLDNLANDPCAGAGGVRFREICLAQGAPANTIGNISNPSAAQANVTVGGNANLDVEKATTYTIGAVFQPEFIPGLAITLDYYDIKVEDAITTPSVSDVVGGCFNSPSVTNPNCLLIRRNPLTGGLDGSSATTPGVSLALSNQGLITTNGVDLSVNYRRDLGFAKLNLSFNGNYTDSSKFKANQDDPDSINRECVGFYSVSCASIQPEFSFNQRSTLTFGPVDVSLLWRYIDGVRYEPQQFADDLQSAIDGECTDPAGADPDGCVLNPEFRSIKARHYFDFSTRFEATDALALTFTVQNLFDKKPPVVGSDVGSTAFNSGNTYPSTYDALGRRFAVGARLRF